MIRQVPVRRETERRSAAATRRVARARRNGGRDAGAVADPGAEEGRTDRHRAEDVYRLVEEHYRSLRGPARRRGQVPAAVRRPRVRGLPRLRAARTRLPAGRLRRLPGRAARRLQLQEARVLPELRRAAHGRERDPPRRRGVSRTARAPVGAERTAPLAVPVRQRSRDHERGARRRPPLSGRTPDRQSWTPEEGSAHRCGHPDPAATAAR